MILDLVETKQNILKEYKEILEERDQIYIFGAKQLGEKLLPQLQEMNYRIKGFIDNNKKIQNTRFHGLNIFSLDDLMSQREKITVIVASINYIGEILQQLKDAGFTKIIPYHILTVYNEEFDSEQPFNGLYQDVYQNKHEYDNLINLFEDDESKFVFNKIMHFRATYDISVYKEINNKLSKEYFEGFIPYTNQPFVDGGGFDGDTAKDFLDYAKNNYSKIYFFEPDEKSFNTAKTDLSKIKNIEFHQKGLSDSYQVMKFDSRGDFGSLFTEEGDIEIECVSLDDIVKEDTAFIKLDIEGYELKALKGAKRLIKNGSILAVCVYHKAFDMWQIPKFILEINPNYKFYLRHYTDTIFETVLYGIV